MTDPDLRPVLLGEAPSRGGDRYHMFPLSGPPARVLCALAGIPPQPDGSTYGRWTWALYDHFECRNVFARYAEATPWSAPRAREAVERDHLSELAGRVVVCLGRRPYAALCGALGCAPSPEFHRVEHLQYRAGAGLLTVAAIPHPSGLNRTLNDADQRQRCRETLQRALDLASRQQ